ncbi:hypothetical protein GRY85_003888 [Salmonella enterica]|nr:hypothetical protein [Salmonella enterica]
MNINHLITKPVKSSLLVQQVDISSCPVEYYIVLPLAGQSNSMAYGEGLPLPGEGLHVQHHFSRRLGRLFSGHEPGDRHRPPASWP